jgi:hypothetical protein
VKECRRLLLDNSSITDATTYLADISGTFFQINIDYLTTPIPLAEFNETKQKMNLRILGLLEEKKIIISGSGLTVKMDKG